MLVLAGIKAGLVGWYFMHLKFEGKWVYLLIVPAIILATILVLALIPDQAMKASRRGRGGIGLAWPRLTEPRGFASPFCASASTRQAEWTFRGNR